MASSKIDGIELRRDVEPEGANYTPHTWAWTPVRRDYVFPSPIVADEDVYAEAGDSLGLGKIDWAALEQFRVF